MILGNCVPLKHVHFNIIFAYLYICLSFPVKATNYYVSTSGNDLNSGTSESLPWNSLAKVNSFTFLPGDQILFKRGDEWQGTINVNSSGTSGSPITYGAYGTGGNPVISGFTTLSGWTDEGGNIYSKAIAIEDNFPNIVLVDGVNTAMGRYPNSGTWLTYESHSGHTSYTDNELAGIPNWSGAQAVIRKNRWILERDDITGHTNSTLTVSPEDVTFNATNGYGYFIQNDLKTLDVPGEWYYDGSKFYIYGNPNTQTVKVSVVNRLLVISGKDYITIEDITFEGANSHAIQNTSGHDIVIQHCNFLNIGMTGIYTDANSVNATMIIAGNSFDTSNNNAIHLRNSSTYAWIKNNTISNIGLIEGSATNVASAVGNAYDAIDVAGANTKIEYNTISNVGHSGIAMRTNTGMVARYNYISNFGLTRYDAGGIYTWNLSGATINNNIVDGSNYISEGIGRATNLALSGIYIDEKTETCNLYDNTVTNVKDFGIKYLNSRTGRLRNNTSYNNGIQFEFAYVYSYGFDVTGMDIKDNVFVSRSASQRVMIYKNDTSPLNQWGVADSNYYARPIDDNPTINASTTTSLGTDMTLAQWKTLTGQDTHSKKSPQTITDENELRFEYNATNSSKTIALSHPMIDIKGTKYATSVTLQPYNSIILINDSNSSSDTSLSTTITNALGNTEVYKNMTTVPNRRAVPVTFSNTGGIKSISIYHEGGTGNVLLGVYSDQDGSPDSLLGVTSATAINSTAGWQTVSLENPVTVVTGQTVWLSWVFENNPGISYTTGTPGRAESSGTWSSGMPDTFGTANYADYIYSIYCSYRLDKYTTENISICDGENYQGWTQTGQYQRTLTAVSGADSIVTTNLTVNPIAYTTEDITIYQGGNYMGWTESGQYERTLPSSSGCDSIVTTDLIVILNKDTTENISICEGDSYEGWTTTGQYQHILMAASGADSIVTTNLTVNPSYTITEDITILKGENYFGWTTSGSYDRNLTTLTGCDSIVTTNLIVMDHFKPVWWNENGQNHMNFYIVDASIQSIALEVNDEIAVYDGDRCVGVAKLTSPINSNDPNTSLFIKASQDDGSGNGFTSGNPVSFRIWDYSRKMEVPVTKITYKNDIAEWITSGEFVPSGTSVVGIGSHQQGQVVPQSISLVRGWNIFSSNVVPEALDMDNVQEKIRSMGYLIKVQDEAGNTYERQNAKDGWINNIGEIQQTEGYKIRVKSDCVLDITGRSVVLPLNIFLRKGSNLISFPYNGSVDAMQVIQPLIDSGILEKVQDEKGNSIEYWGSSIGWINGIGNFTSGEGYLVQVNQNGELPILAAYEKSGLLLPSELETEHFKVDYEGNGSGHMNINIEELTNSDIQLGDEIAAFDGTICVGAVKISENNIENNVVSISASVSDNDVQNGFIEGDPIELKVWHVNKSAEFQTKSEVIKGNLLYNEYGSVFVHLTGQTETAVNAFESVKVDMYPNPANNQVTIRFSTFPEQGTQIELTDMTGKALLTREVQSTKEVLNIQSQPAGMYLVKIISRNGYKVNKLIKN